MTRTAARTRLVTLFAALAAALMAFTGTQVVTAAPADAHTVRFDGSAYCGHQPRFSAVHTTNGWWASFHRSWRYSNYHYHEVRYDKDGTRHWHRIWCGTYVNGALRHHSAF